MSSSRPISWPVWLVTGRPEDAGQRHDGVEDPLGGQNAAGAPPALVRGPLGRIAAAGEGQPGTGRRRRRGVAKVLPPVRRHGGRSGRKGRVGAPASAGTGRERCAGTSSDPRPVAASCGCSVQQLSRRGCGEVCRRCYWEVRPFAWPHLLPLVPRRGRHARRAAAILPRHLVPGARRRTWPRDARRVPCSTWI